MSNALDKCERDIAKIKKSIAGVEDALFCRVAPFLETTPIPMSVDAIVILVSGFGILEATTSVSLGSPVPVLSGTRYAVSTDANAFCGDGPSNAHVASFAKGEVATALVYKSFLVCVVTMLGCLLCVLFEQCVCCFVRLCVCHNYDLIYHDVFAMFKVVRIRLFNSLCEYLWVILPYWVCNTSYVL